MIHGMEAIYNEIQPWNHTEILHLFGADPSASKSYQVKTRSDLDELFKDENFSSAPYIQVIIYYYFF
jgi:pyruvate decarboxylase